MTELDLSGEGKASDAEIDNAAAIIFNELRIFDSPKDAGLAIAVAHHNFIKASFPPEFKKDAIAALEKHVELIKKLIEEEWQ